jgi:rubrerythrin
MGILKNIKEGWTNYIKSNTPEGVSPEVDRLAKGRANICASCPELVESELFRWVDRIVSKNGSEMLQRVKESYRTEEDIPEALKDENFDRRYKCGKCGCAFPANVYSPGKKCPLGKW